METNAPPRSVWEVLVDFPEHRHWNPFIRSIEGSPREGETRTVFIQPVGGKGMTLRPRVLRAVPGHELPWLRRFLLPGVFDGEHFFKIESPFRLQRLRVPTFCVVNSWTHTLDG